MTLIRFDKYEGLGNDFIVVEVSAETDLSPHQARALCDRHYGIGADGVLLLLPTREHADARMIVLNADGSRPEMCGNGLRCAALHLSRRSGHQHASHLVDTDAGPRQCRVERTDATALVTIGLGAGTDLGEYRRAHAGKDLVFRRISMGNPHAVLFESVADDQIDQLGPAVCSAIAGGANVEFVSRRDATNFDVVVWERGVGRTLACGTGAGAVAVAAALSGLAPFTEPIRVNLPGGALELRVATESLDVTLKGPARHVFSGEVPAW